jgi:Ribonuclease G/E
VTLVVDPGPFDWTLARIDAGRLAEVRVVERIEGIEEGLFRARVTSFAPDLGGAFVDVGGSEVLARLPSALRRSRPAEGSFLLVQGVRDAIADKPARATASWRVPGLNLDLRGHPGAPLVDEAVQGAARRRLTGRGVALFPNRPVTLHARADEAADATLLREAEALAEIARTWTERAAKLGRAGAVTTFEDRLRAVRHALGVAAETAVVAPRWARLEVAHRLSIPSAQVTGEDDPFEAAGVAPTWARAQGPEVPLADGGRLYVEPTRAVVAVDLDRGSSTARVLDLDRAAVSALAEAILVRQLGGQMVVDLLEPGGSDERFELETALRTLLAPSGTRLVTLLGSGLAILERPRRTAALHERREPIRDAAADLLLAMAAAPLAGFRAAPDLASFLARPRVHPLVSAWCQARAITGHVAADAGLAPCTFERS